MARSTKAADKPAKKPAPTPPPEKPAAAGWGEIRRGEKVAHYYRNTRSLCGKVVLYRGPLEPATETPGPADCGSCTTKLGGIS